MDQALTLHLLAVDKEALPQLRVRKLGAGKYEIDGRRVSVHWSSQGSPGGDLQLLALEDRGQADQGPGAAADEPQPLETYLTSAANVAVALRGRAPGAPAVARIPQEKRLTFGGGLGRGDTSALEQVDVLERCESMRKACEEARLREWAAAAYEQHGLAWPSGATLPPSLASVSGAAAAGGGGGSLASGCAVAGSSSGPCGSCSGGGGSCTVGCSPCGGGDGGPRGSGGGSLSVPPASRLTVGLVAAATASARRASSPPPVAATAAMPSPTAAVSARGSVAAG